MRIKYLKNKVISSNFHVINGFYFRNTDIIEKYSVKKTGNVEFSILDKDMGKVSSDLLAFFLSETCLYFKEDCKENNENFFLEIFYQMLIFARINYGSIVRGGTSYCSHSEGYLTMFYNSEELREKYEQLFLEKFNVLQSVYVNKQIFSGEKYEYFKILISKIKQQSELEIKNNNIFFSNFKYKSKNENLYNSQFHNNLMKNTGMLKYMDSLEFRKKRFCTILFYYYLKNLGITSQERFLLCYLVYRTIECVEGIDYKNTPFDI